MANLHDETNVRRDRDPAAEFSVVPGANPVLEADRYWQYHLETNQSVVTKYWTGVKQSQRRCAHCGHSSYSFDTFDQLLLAIPSNRAKKQPLTLEACLFGNLSPERLKDYRCDGCNTADHVVQATSLARIPELLCICLNRFHTQYYSRGQPVIRKTLERISFDFDNVDLDAFVAEGVSGTHPYECFAVVVHRGNTTESGHYFAYVRDPHDPYSNTWYCADDADVREHGRPGTGSKEKEKILAHDDAVPYILYLRRKRARL